MALNISLDGSTGSQLSARSAQLEAARAQAAQRLSQRQRVLSRKRREAALAAKAAMIERMQRDIAAADAEIQVGWGRQCWQAACGMDHSIHGELTLKCAAGWAARKAAAVWAR